MKKNYKGAVALLFMLGMICAAAANTVMVRAAGGQSGSAHEPITIHALSRSFPADFLDALHEAYPEINLEMISYGALNASGFSRCELLEDEMGDIYMSTQCFEKDIQSERLVDLSKYSFVNNYATSFLNSLEVDGSIYLLPSGYSLIGINYNKTLLEENGWELPTDFEQMLALKEQVEEAGYKFMANAMVLPGYPFAYFFNLGNTVYFGTQDGINWKENFPKGEASVSGNPGLMKAIEYYKKWIDHGLIIDEHTSPSEYQENADTLFFLFGNQVPWEAEAKDGRTYEYAMMPWLSEDGTGNMLTYNVQGFWGINKRLEEPGNEQKLEDALHVMEFISSEKGQEALGVGSTQYLSPLNGAEVPADGPFESVAQDVRSGHLVQLVYVGWEKLIVPMADELRSFINGEIDTEQLTKNLDALGEKASDGSSLEIYGTATEDLTYEKTAELCAIAYGKAADADCAMVSLNESRGGLLYNHEGIGWHIWAGDIDSERVDIIRSEGTSLTVQELTGEQIKDMLKAGYDVNGDGEPYPYLLVTRGGMDLEDDATYRLVTSTMDLSSDVRETLPVLEITPADAIRNYIMELGVFGASDIVWE